MQQLLDPETVLLYYSLGERRSFLWVVTETDISSFVLPPRREIETLARRLHETWSTLGPTSQESEEATAAALADMILSPADGRLQTQRLAVVADGALHYVPFAALPIPGGTGEASRVIERYEVVRLPSAAVLATRRLGRAAGQRPATIAVIADPIFSLSDPRLLETSIAAPEARLETFAARDSAPSELGPTAGFGRLPGTRLEAAAIADQFAPDHRWVALGLAASRDALGDLAAYSIVHFATHAVIDTEHPELSGLVLSQFDAAGRRANGILRLHDIYRLDLDAELVVLSGCRTGLGRELRGEGLQGLTGGFFYAGARRVAASLWSVADQATAELMGRFYRAHLTEGLRPAAALRRAQLALAAERRFRDPYYWAPFVLHGDWR